jgi:hypothetical protein
MVISAKSFIICSYRKTGWGYSLLLTIHGFADYLPLIADWIASRSRGSMRW